LADIFSELSNTNSKPNLMNMLDPANASGWEAEGKRLAVNLPEVTVRDAVKFVAEMTPILGDAIAAKELWDMATSDNPNWPLIGAMGGATVIGLIPGIGDAAAKGIKAGARKMLDTAKRVEVDPNAMGSMFGNVRLKPKVDAPFDMGRGIGGNGGPTLRIPYSRSGSDIADRLANIPSAKVALGVDDVAPGGMFTTIKDQQPNILRDHISDGYLSNEVIPPTPTTIADYLGRTSMAIVGDNTGRHTVTGQGGMAFKEPVDSMAGFQYIDVPGQGYAGAQSATSSKLNEAILEAKKGNNPFYNSFLMAERSGDFSQHVNDIYGRMFQNASIDPSDIKKIDESIRKIGMSKIVKVYDKSGNVVKKPDGSAKTKSITVYPFEDFPSTKDPFAVGAYLQNLPTGTQRAAFIKGMDKAGLHKMGVPKVADARLAAADADQIGMDWGTVGYRIFTPDLEKGLIKTTPQQSTTYDSGVDKIGNSETLLGQGSRGIPANLFYRDLAESQRAKGTGGKLLMTSPDYKIYEGSPKRSQQLIDNLAVETIDTFLEVERRFGRETAIKYANDVVSSGKVTSSVIDAARKANAPAWMIGALTTSAGLSAANMQSGNQPEGNQL